MEFVIPYRTHHYHTPLSEEDVRAAVQRHTHLGGWDKLVLKNKPYFGELAPGFFCVRESGRRKLYSNRPTLTARLAPHETGTCMVIKMHPHVMVAGLAALLMGACAYFVLASIVKFFGAWDARPVATWLMNFSIISACIVLPYHFSAVRTLRFWKNELRLRETIG